MAAVFVELTRVETEAHGTPVLVNLGTVAWIEPTVNGTSRIVFAVSASNDQDGAGSLAVVVRESPQEIGALAGVVQHTDREAIAQAWVDQRSRRDFPDDRE